MTPAKLLPPMHAYTIHLKTLLAGLLVCVLITFISLLLTKTIGGPTLIYALLLGMMTNRYFLRQSMAPGIKFTTSTLLRTGVALMGLRLALDTVTNLGIEIWLAVIVAVSATIGASFAFGRLLGRNRMESMLCGGAVAICGASAAMAISSAMPSSADKERMTLFTVVGVTFVSTICMVVYPSLAQILSFSDTKAAILFGMSIHDVAQVVGAALLFSDSSAETASFVKLIRVAMLAPVVAFTAWAMQRKSEITASTTFKLPVPGFLIVFFLLFGLVNMIDVPSEVLGAGQKLSNGLIILAVAGLGVKTSIKDLLSVGWRPIALILLNTLLLLGIVLALLAMNII